LCTRLSRVRALVAPRGHFSAVTVVSDAAGVKMEPVKAVTVIRGEKGKYLMSLRASISVSKNAKNKGSIC